MTEPRITGLNITNFNNLAADNSTSFDFTFDKDIEDNEGLYFGTNLTASSKVATIRFCVMIELLRDFNSTNNTAVVVNYAEFAFGYNATLNGTILLEEAFPVAPAAPETGQIADDTFTVSATVCGPDRLLTSGILNQGDSVQICINSTSYPEASISGIESLTYTAPLSGVGDVVLDAIVGGKTKDILTKFDVATDCGDGDECIVITQLQGSFYPPNGSMNVSITGKATMELGGRRVLADVVVSGDRRLQEEGTTSLSGFSMNVETTAFDASGTTKKGVATSIIMAFFAVASLYVV